MATHFLDETQPHAFWDNTLAPRLHIRPGDSVEFETLDGSGGQISPESAAEALTSLDRSRIHALSGPVFIDGAEPGDTLVVEVLSLEHRGWGWSCVSPTFGLLAGEFSEYYLHHFRLEGEWCWFRDDIRIPYNPFCGVMGVAPREAGRFGTGPPRDNAGNVDIRDLAPGARVFLPVHVPGALFSCGDCHAAQGDGEVNGTAIEAPMLVHLRFDLVRSKSVPELQFITPPENTRSEPTSAGYFVTTAHGPDLYANAQQAVRYMIDHLVSQHHMTPEEAYVLCGAAVDLRISQIVDRPNYIVSAYLPRGIFL